MIYLLRHRVLRGKCEDIMPLEDAIAIIDSVYMAESVNKECKY